MCSRGSGSGHDCFVGSLRSQRWVAVIVAIVAPALVGACASEGRTNSGGVASTGQGTATNTAVSVATTSTTLVPLLAAGEETGRDAVPWSEVGPGWFVAIWAPGGVRADITTTTPPAASIDAGREATLFLVDPAGGRYRLMSGGDLAVGQVVSWSGDRTHALLWDQYPGMSEALCKRLMV